jgi:hypothetical protein
MATQRGERENKKDNGRGKWQGIREEKKKKRTRKMEKASRKENKVNEQRIKGKRRENAKEPVERHWSVNSRKEKVRSKRE